MNDELRAAAQEAIAWYRAQSPHVAERKQAQLLKTLANGILSEHPADDTHKRLAKVKAVIDGWCDKAIHIDATEEDELMESAAHEIRVALAEGEG